MKKLVKILAFSFLFIGAAFMLTGCQSQDNTGNKVVIEKKQVNQNQVQQTQQTQKAEPQQVNNTTNEDQELVQILDTLEKE